MLAGLDIAGCGERFKSLRAQRHQRREDRRRRGERASQRSPRAGETGPITYRRRTVNTGYKAGNIVILRALERQT